MESRGATSGPGQAVWKTIDQKVEIGILRKVKLSNILPADRCFLYIERHTARFWSTFEASAAPLSPCWIPLDAAIKTSRHGANAFGTSQIDKRIDKQNRAARH